MKRKITRFAFAGWWPCRTASGLFAVGNVAGADCARTSARPSVPKPAPTRLSISRREKGNGEVRAAIFDLLVFLERGGSTPLLLFGENLIGHTPIRQGKKAVSSHRTPRI